ncbi:hypothetical protein ACHAWF_009977 [Thalassiosira exigua]
MEKLTGALTIMIFFSIAVQASEGSTFAIVPFVDKKFPGAVSGTVSSGGNISGLIFSGLNIELKAAHLFYAMGSCCLASVPLTFLIKLDDSMDDASPTKDDGPEVGRMSVVSISQTAKSSQS